MLRGLVTALRTLTILPVPGRDAEKFSSSLYWFPLVGLLVGAIQAGAGYVIMLSGWEEFAAAGVLFIGVVVTRGIHADGFADVADGFFGGGTVESRLRIMKDSAVGSFGAIALILLFLFKWIVLAKLLAFGLYAWIIYGSILARMVQVFLAGSLPYARAGKGTASGFVEGAGRRHIGTAFSLSMAIFLFLPATSFLQPLTAFLAASVAGGSIALLSRVKISGVTGDVLGASSEITEVFVWSVGALFLLQL